MILFTVSNLGKGLVVDWYMAVSSLCVTIGSLSCSFFQPTLRVNLIANKPVLIAHDYFAIRGGGERLALTLADAIQADVMFGYRTDESYDQALFPNECIDLKLPQPLRRAGLRAAALSVRFRLARTQAAAYDLRIFSGVAAPFAAPARGRGRNVLYCHTPPRFLYDQKQYFAGRAHGNPVRQFALNKFEIGYKAAVERMDLLVANSATVQERIKTYLGKQSTVVYPPCDLEAFRWIEQGDYYLSTARLSPLKRVEIIVRAFCAMPQRNLVVASSGEDMARLKAIAAGAPNIRFLGWVSDKQLSELIGKAIATIYVPVEEDFGMSPVESMAAGKPVIGVAEGGLRETIVDGETGVLLLPKFNADDLAQAVVHLSAERALSMRSDCEARAQLFSRERFLMGMRQSLASIV
jgi:glycosyltransferase involved in cell wall biosynthesis